MLQKIKGKEIEETSTAKEFQIASDAIGPPDDFDKLTPRARVKALSSAHIGRLALTRYLPIGAEINIPRAANASIPSVRSGVMSYLKFCDPMWRRSFPQPRIRCDCGMPHLTRGAFKQYLAHLQKAATLLNHPMDFPAPSIRNIAQ